jgi:hypothetical protein
MKHSIIHPLLVQSATAAAAGANEVDGAASGMIVSCGSQSFYMKKRVKSVYPMSEIELAGSRPQRSGGRTNEDEGCGILLQMPAASAESYNQDLTPEELLYLQVYQYKLQDGGFVQDGLPPSTPPPWQLRHKTSVLSQLRLMRWFAFLVCFGIGAGSGIYLLDATIKVITVFVLFILALLMEGL